MLINKQGRVSSVISTYNGCQKYEMCRLNSIRNSMFCCRQEIEWGNRYIILLCCESHKDCVVIGAWNIFFLFDDVRKGWETSININIMNTHISAMMPHCNRKQ